MILRMFASSFGEYVSPGFSIKSTINSLPEHKTTIPLTSSSSPPIKYFPRKSLDGTSIASATTLKSNARCLTKPKSKLPIGNAIDLYFFRNRIRSPTHNSFNSTSLFAGPPNLSQTKFAKIEAVVHLSGGFFASI